MKTKQLLSAFCALLFLTFSSYSQAPPLTTLGTATLSSGAFSVPVTVAGFVNVGNISMTINYDPAVLVFSGVSLNSGLLPGNTVVTPVSDQSGRFRLSYTSQQAIVLTAPVNTLLTLTFTPNIGFQGVQASLSWGRVNGDCEITPPFPAAFIPPITVVNQYAYFINSLTTSIASSLSEDKEEFSLYPNPASSYINLKLSKSFNGVAQVSISSVNGVIIKNLKTDLGESMINVSDLPTGPYYMIVSYDLKKVTKKFLVIR